MVGVRNVRGEDLESETQRTKLCTAGVWGVDKRKLARVTSSSIHRAHLHISEAWAGVERAGGGRVTGRGETGLSGREAGRAAGRKMCAVVVRIDVPRVVQRLDAAREAARLARKRFARKREHLAVNCLRASPRMRIAVSRAVLCSSTRRRFTTPFSVSQPSARAVSPNRRAA